ncbi:MAG: glycosyl hydrolase [Planctomyces sp.]|nr:glycosyl hydrolase [Planctomyces sp.]
MKRLHLLFTGIILLVLSTIVKADEGEFVSLFNGKDLTGWHHTDGATVETENITGYVVDDGIVRCDKGGKFLYTPEKYKNFVFKLEYRLPPAGNNGVGIRANVPGNPAFDGMEIQLLDDTAEVYKTLEDYQYNGSVYGILPAKTGHLKPQGEWNEMEITAIGSKIKVVLNGETIVDGDIKEATKDGNPDKREHHGLHNAFGHIVLCGHGDPVEFRGMAVKVLD